MTPQLAGAGVPPVRFSEVVDELRGKFVPAYPLPGCNVAFHCFQYEPGERVSLSWGFLFMILAGTLDHRCDGLHLHGVTHRKVRS